MGLVCGLVIYQNRSASIGSAVKVTNISVRTLILKTLLKKKIGTVIAHPLFSKNFDFRFVLPMLF